MSGEMAEKIVECVDLVSFWRTSTGFPEPGVISARLINDN